MNNDKEILVGALGEEPQLDEGLYMSLKGISKPGKLNFDGKCNFIASLITLHNVAAACRAIGVSRVGAYSAKNKDLEFSKAWDDAIEEGVDNLIQEGQRRAFTGVKEPIFHQGVQIGSKQKYSDVLLMFLVKAKRAEYRDNKSIDMSGELKTSAGVLLVPSTEITDEDWETLAIAQQEKMMKEDDAK